MSSVGDGMASGREVLEDGRIKTSRIFVQGLPKDFLEEDVEELFGRIGTIRTDENTDKPQIDLYMTRNRRFHEPSRPAGQAQITFDYPRDARRAVELLHNMEFPPGTRNYLRVLPCFDQARDNSRKKESPEMDDFDAYWYAEGREWTGFTLDEYITQWREWNRLNLYIDEKERTRLKEKDRIHVVKMKAMCEKYRADKLKKQRAIEENFTG